jgi:protein SCO1/2
MRGTALRLMSIAAIAALAAFQGAWGAQRHPAQGIVIEVAQDRRSMVVSCEEIPGYMGAMEMKFTVRGQKVPAEVRPGTVVTFTLVDDNHVPYAEAIHAGSSADFGSEQVDAGALTALQGALSPAVQADLVQPGQLVPDFVLTDQVGQAVHLSDLRGKVVVLTFGYSRCPFPDYCYRLSNNLSVLQKRFAVCAGRDLVLLTIAIDPEHDQGKVLREYAAVFHAQPADWHFLTGDLAVVKQVSALFGMNFWRTEGLLTHSLHTAVLDRNGKLVANIEGNQFTAQQLGDLVETVIDRPD